MLSARQEDGGAIAVLGRVGVVALLVTGAPVILSTSPAEASSVITVTSAADVVADDGDCTLREAIEASNTDTTSGAAPGECPAGSGSGDTIGFGIAGAGVRTVQIGSSLPSITSPVLIDGYSQPGSSPNSSPAPEPMDGTLLIEVDGSAIPLEGGPCMRVEASNVEIRGLVINNCGGSGIGGFRADGLVLNGNYIGTDPTGLVPRPAGRDYVGRSIAHGVFLIATNDAQIGGSNPPDRNIIAANQGGDIFIGNELDDPNLSENNTIQGNYIGVGADGVTPLPSGWAWGLGNAILFGNSHDDQIGGSAPGAVNVIGSSSEFGVSFRDGCSDARIEGNYIGTDFTGNAALVHPLGSGHVTGGVHVSAVTNAGFTRGSHDITVGGSNQSQRNVISGNAYPLAGYDTNGVWIHDGAYNVAVRGNFIGVGADGATDVGNEGEGVRLGSTDVVVGGDQPTEANTIAFNGSDGISVDQNEASNNAAFGNRIYSNGGLPIDLAADGPTRNDPADADSGPNDLLNHPELEQISEAANTTITYRLDVPPGNYRIDAYSEHGRTHLGVDTATSDGTETSSSLTVAGRGHEDVVLSATLVDGTLAYGFGPTSELGGDETHPRPFDDVAEGSWLSEAAEWAQGVGVITGYPDNTFRPNNVISRSEFVVWLHKAAGRPNPTTPHRFLDVGAGSWHEPAIAWAAEHGHMTGYPDNTFRGTRAISRAQAIVALWKAQGSPSAAGQANYHDVLASHWYAPALDYLDQQGAVGGYPDLTFRPNRKTTRGQVLAMLYRIVLSYR